VNFFLPSSTLSPSEFFVKTVQINSLRDVHILFAAYSVYGRISVHFCPVFCGFLMSSSSKNFP